MKARAADGSLTEAAFQRQVEELAKHYGWRTFHAPDNKPSIGRAGRAGRQRVTPGFPDCLFVRDGELIAAELKSDKGRVRPEQREWLEDLGQVPGVEAYTWRPADFDDVHARLARGRVRQEPLA